MTLITEVYCGECKHLVKCGHINQYKQCRKGVVKRNYMGITTYETACHEKNENKDCKDYKKKGWFR